MSKAAAGNPRRTPLIGKIAIYGWTLIRPNKGFNLTPQQLFFYTSVDN